MKNFFVLGSLNVDMSINCDVFPENGETVIGHDFVTTFGGKGANQAIAVAKTGGNSTLLGAVGNDDWGTQLKNNLLKNNVNGQHIVTKEGSSGVAIITIFQGDNRIILDSGANYLYEFKDFKDILKNTAKKGDYFIAQLETEIKVVEEGLKLAKSLGMTTVLNPAPAKKISEEIYEYIDYLIPNKLEAYFLAEKSLDSNLEDVFAVFHSKGIKNVIITLGEKGVSYYKDNKLVIEEAVKTTVVDTTAAGDTFIGAFTVMLEKTNNFEEAIKYANKASALTITKRGAQQTIPTEEEVLNYIKTL